MVRKSCLLLCSAGAMLMCSLPAVGEIVQDPLPGPYPGPCTTDPCPGGGGCQSWADCPDDGDPCTNRACSVGVCSYPQINCDDNDVCTVDHCVAGVCENMFFGCLDSDGPCNGGFICDPMDGCLSTDPPCSQECRVDAQGDVECVECLTGDDCPLDRPLCDTGPGVCVQCFTDQQCEPQFCDTSTCRDCLTDGHCDDFNRVYTGRVPQQRLSARGELPEQLVLRSALLRSGRHGAVRARHAAVLRDGRRSVHNV